MKLTRRALLIGVSSLALMGFLGVEYNQSGLLDHPAQHDVSAAVEDIAVVGTMIVDGRVTTAMSVFLPVTGDANENATAYLQYRLAGGGAYTRGPDLVYISDPQNATWSEQSFAGGLVELTPDTAYDLQVVLTDPDGTTGQPATQTLSSELTRPVPPLASAQAVDCTVTSKATLDSCIASIPPDMSVESDHYVIEIAAGTTITLTSDYLFDHWGSEENRIMIRGENRLTSIIDVAGAYTFWPRGSWIHVEDLTLRNSAPGLEVLRLYGPQGSRSSTGKVVRGNYLEDIEGFGLAPFQGANWIYIADNVIEGVLPQGVDQGAGGDRGITIAGTSVEVRNNTLSGFVDSIVTNNNWDIYSPSVGVFIHHNEILWGTDDGIELDFSDRNTFAYYNSINNVPSGISFQPCFDGPCFAFNNLIYNNKRGPWKIKGVSADDSFGVQIFHNTVIGGGVAWKNAFEPSGEHLVVNDLYVTTSDLLGAPDNSQTVHLTTGPLESMVMDHNAYYEDKSFNVSAYTPTQSGGSLAAFKTSGPQIFAQNSIILNGNPLENVTLDFDTVGWSTCRDLLAGSDIEPTATTNALNAALDMPYWNDNDGTVDIGAVQRGETFPTVGASWHIADACP